ncbi:MAG: LTA synthase family protein [Clostridia bacterium]|nr:LTA synthase family protein [Clostridia bacterium]
MISKIKSLINKIKSNPYLSITILSFMLCLLIESLSRHNPFGGFIFMFKHPLAFLYDTALICTTLFVAMFFKKRSAVLTLVSLLWLTMGISNFVILFFRSTPFSFVDITLLGYALQMADIYLTKLELIMIILMVVGAIAAICIAFVRTKKVERPKKIWYHAIAFALAIALLVSLGTVIGKKNDNSIVNAYDRFGFAYCFSRSIFDVGIDSPSDYENTVEDILALLPDATNTAEVPNVLFIQLESFFDVDYIKNLSFSENPIPNFTALKNSNPHGFLSMPSIGAGTANSEFEVLTGMNLDFFGFNEYPYKTILQGSTCESMAYSLKESGAQSAVAIHNNTATFYDRNKVFANLGFDCFISEEFMNGIEFNELGWAYDSILTPQIIRSLDATEGSDFVYTITVQSHGKYPDEQMDDEQAVISVFDETNPENSLMSFEYYVNQLREVDNFIGDLMSEIEKRKEDTVVVFFGDHLPNLDLTETDLENENLYQTEYVIWNNCGLDFEGGDIEAYQLSSKVLGVLGADSAVMTRYHLYTDGNLEDMKTLEYDMLYGDHIITAGVLPYEKTDLALGMADQIVTGINERGDFTIIEGSNFNDYSKVMINDKVQNTLFYSDTALIILSSDFETGDTICVAQVAGDGTVLWKTDNLSYE